MKRSMLSKEALIGEKDTDGTSPMLNHGLDEKIGICREDASLVLAGLANRRPDP